MNRFGIALIYLLFAASASTLATDAMASDRHPTGAVVLRIFGDIAHTNTSGEMSFDRAMLEDIGMFELRTETPWTAGANLFSGILVRDLMAYVQANGSSVVARALNDYRVTIPISDFEMYDVIIAMQRDGEYLTVQGRGPFWVIYPWSRHNELQNELYYSRSIWQLKSLEVTSN